MQPTNSSPSPRDYSKFDLYLTKNNKFCYIKKHNNVLLKTIDSLGTKLLEKVGLLKQDHASLFRAASKMKISTSEQITDKQIAERVAMRQLFKSIAPEQAAMGVGILNSFWSHFLNTFKDLPAAFVNCTPEQFVNWFQKLPLHLQQDIVNQAKTTVSKDFALYFLKFDSIPEFGAKGTKEALKKLVFAELQAKKIGAADIKNWESCPDQNDLIAQDPKFFNLVAENKRNTAKCERIAAAMLRPHSLAAVQKNYSKHEKPIQEQFEKAALTELNKRPLLWMQLPRELTTNSQFIKQAFEHLTSNPQAARQLHSLLTVEQKNLVQLPPEAQLNRNSKI